MVGISKQKLSTKKQISPEAQKVNSRLSSKPLEIINNDEINPFSVQLYFLDLFHCITYSFSKVGWSVDSDKIIKSLDL